MADDQRGGAGASRGDDDLPPFAVAVPAAGSGQRMGGRRKQFLELAGEPVLSRALRPFLDLPGLQAVVVALPAEDASDPPSWLLEMDARVGVVTGGETRRASVGAALRALPESARVLVVHDGARPLVTREVVEACVRVAATGVGAVAGWPASDTIKEVDGAGVVVRTPDRSRLWHAQTPQAFPREFLLEAYGGEGPEPGSATDDAVLVEALGRPVRMVRGSPDNLKVTRQGDLERAGLALERRGEG